MRALRSLANFWRHNKEKGRGSTWWHIMGDTPVPCSVSVYLTLLKRDGTDSSCFHFKKPVSIVFGSGEDCDVKILRTGVQEQHCSLIIDSKQVKLISHNKARVTINTDPVIDETVVENEDLIAICHRIFRISIEDPSKENQSYTTQITGLVNENSSSYTSPVRPTFSPVGVSPIPAAYVSIPPLFASKPPTQRAKATKAKVTKVPSPNNQPNIAQQSPPQQPTQQEVTQAKAKKKQRSRKSKKPQSPLHVQHSPIQPLPSQPSPSSPKSPPSPPSPPSPSHPRVTKQYKKPNIFILSKDMHWRPKHPKTPTPTSPPKEPFLADTSPISPPADSVLGNVPVDPTNRMSDDEPLALKKRLSSQEESSNQLAAQQNAEFHKKRPMDEVTYLQWNSRHLAMTANAKTRSRKKTDFLRATEDPRGIKPTAPSRGPRPSHTSSNGAMVDSEGKGEQDNQTTTNGISPEGAPHAEMVSPRSQLRRRCSTKNDPLVILPDSSPSPTSPNIKEETKEELPSAKTTKKKSGSKNKRANQQVQKDVSLGQKITEFLETLCREEDEDGLLKCAQFLRILEKSDLENRKAWDAYKKAVKSPICIGDIQAQCNEYSSVAELSKDFMKLIQNAKIINSDFTSLDYVDWLEQSFIDWVKTVDVVK